MPKGIATRDQGKVDSIVNIGKRVKSPRKPKGIGFRTSGERVWTGEVDPLPLEQDKGHDGYEDSGG